MSLVNLFHCFGFDFSCFLCLDKILYNRILKYKSIIYVDQQLQSNLKIDLLEKTIVN
jgi:hypothetical protein